MTERLLLWSERHALLMAAAIAVVLLRPSPAPVTVIAGASFLGLILRFRNRWTPGGRFGPANAITLLRLLAAPILPAGFGGETYWPAVLALTILAADGLDGWAARRWNTTSEFGHVFDQETDAFFVLMLCLTLYLQGRFGAWVLLPGALRYAYVLFARLIRPPRRMVPGDRATRALGVAAIVIFSLCLLPLGNLRGWLAAGASLGLAGSFLYSTWRLYRPSTET